MPKYIDKDALLNKADTGHSGMGVHTKDQNAIALYAESQTALPEEIKCARIVRGAVLKIWRINNELLYD